MNNDLTMTPRVAPHSLDAEIGVLGGILIDNSVFDEQAVTDLTPAMFYREGHRTLFSAMLALRGSGTPIDLVTVKTELERVRQLDEVGGLTYLVGLGDQVPSSAYSGHYAAIVREKWVLRELIRESNQLQRTAYDAQLPLEDVLAQASRIGANLDTAAARGTYGIGEIVGDILADMENGTADLPLSTGLLDLDEQLGGGLYPQSLNILAARPSMGKSALALNIAENVAEGLNRRGDDGQVAIVSLEMPRKALVMRMLSSGARIGHADVRAHMNRKGRLTDRQQERFINTASRLAAQPMEFLDDPTADANWRSLPAKLRRLHKEKPLRLVVVDYLQLLGIASDGRNDAGRVQEISTISRGLKQLARELGCPFLVLSQLSRAVEQRPNHRPMLSDLRESGAIEQDADSIMFIYRDEYYNKETDQQGIAEIIVGKQRNGPVGTVKLQFHSAHVRFNDLAPEGV